VILENRVGHFDQLSTDGRRVLEGICQDLDKERDEEVALDKTEQGKSDCEPKFDQADGKRTRANQEKIGLNVWLTGSK
jgi:hypothetical protein